MVDFSYCYFAGMLPQGVAPDPTAEFMVAWWETWCVMFPTYYNLALLLVVPLVCLNFLVLVCIVKPFLKVLSRCVLFAIALTLSLLNRG